MTRRQKPQNRIPTFKGFRTFKPLVPENQEELPGGACDPLLRPEEQGTIKRYLQYADTLINGPETSSPETASEETPADNEPGRETSLLGARRATDKNHKNKNAA